METVIQPSGSFSTELVGKELRLAWLIDLSTLGSVFVLLLAGSSDARPGIAAGVELFGVVGVQGTKMSTEVSLTKALIEGKEGAGLSSPSSSSLLALP